MSEKTNGVICENNCSHTRKLKIWDESAKSCDDPHQYFVKLEIITVDKPENNEEKNGHNDIHLFVCDKNGEKIESGRILFIDQDYNVIVIANNFTDVTNLKTDEKCQPITVTMHDIEMYNAKVEETLSRRATRLMASIIGKSMLYNDKEETKH